MRVRIFFLLKLFFLSEFKLIRQTCIVVTVKGFFELPKLNLIQNLVKIYNLIDTNAEGFSFFIKYDK